MLDHSLKPEQHFLWHRTGYWPGGTVTAVVSLLDQCILAGSQAGIFQSVDNGATWTRSCNGMADPAVVCLITTGTREPTLFASTESGRLYMSLNAGTQWQELTHWAGLGVATALACSPNYALDKTIIVATAHGPFRSQDSGKTWESSSFGLLDLEVLCVAFDPNFLNNSSIWLGTASGGLYRSRNSGRSWHDSGNGLPDSAIQCLAFAEHSLGASIFLGTEDNGIYRSADNGKLWTCMLPAVGVNSMSVNQDGTQMLAGSTSGMLISTDSGNNWTTAIAGAWTALDICISHPRNAFAASWREGMHYSLDGGHNWSVANGTVKGPLSAHVPPEALITANGDLLIADRDGGWVQSNDRGSTWQSVEATLDTAITALAGATTNGIFTTFAAAGQTLWRCPQNSERDRITLSEPIDLLAVIPGCSDSPFLLVAHPDGTLYASIDNGSSWRGLSQPWTTQTLAGAACSYDEEYKPVLFTITYTVALQIYKMEIWRSLDCGNHWEVLAEFEAHSPVIRMHALPDLEQSLYIATQNQLIRIYKQTSTQTIVIKQEVLPVNLQIKKLTHSAAGILYAATNQGIWRKINTDKLDRYGSGLEGYDIVAVLAVPDGSLGAVTLGGEVWWLNI